MNTNQQTQTETQANQTGSDAVDQAQNFFVRNKTVLIAVAGVTVAAVLGGVAWKTLGKKPAKTQPEAGVGQAGVGQAGPAGVFVVEPVEVQ